jgi:hypothetical protein
MCFMELALSIWIWRTKYPYRFWCLVSNEFVFTFC